MNQEQLAILPTQMALKLISTGLRGAIPVALGLSGLAIAGTVYGAVKGVSATKKYIDKPKAGNNKGYKILNELKNKVVKKTKDGKTVYENSEVHAFELRNELYLKFEEQAKQLGIAFAAASNEKITHIITDSQNKPIIDNLIKNLAKEIKENKEAVNQGTENKSSQNTEQEQENLYKEVAFKDSLWNKIINFTMEKILNPLKNSGQVDLEEQKKGNIIYFDKYKKKELSEAVNNISQHFQEIKSDKVKQEKLYQEFEAFNNVISIQKFNKKAQKSNIHEESNKKAEKLNVHEETVAIDITKMPETLDMLKLLGASYKVEGIQNRYHRIEKISEDLQKQGFKGNFVIDEESNVNINFDIKDKNNIILFSQKMIDELTKGESRGLNVIEARKEAFATFNKKASINSRETNGNIIQFNKKTTDKSKLANNPVL